MRPIEFFALVVVIAGWAATHLLSEARERRKEARGQLDKFFEKLQNIETAGRDFHAAQEFSPSGRAVLISGLDRLERALGRIGMLNPDHMTRPIIFLRRAITLKNFDPSIFVPQASDTEVMEDIETCVLDLEDEIERQYRYHYPSTFPYFRILSGRVG